MVAISWLIYHGQCHYVMVAVFLWQDGQQFGDEYLAELDYMEVVERFKEGYESDVNEDEGLGADGDSDYQEDSDR